MYMVREYKLINNSEKYYEFIRILRTHEENIHGFKEKVEITPEDQLKYMSKYGQNYHICLLGDTPVGFIGEVDSDIRLAVHPDYKRKGIGKFMLNELMDLKDEIQNVINKITGAKDNAA